MDISTTSSLVPGDFDSNIEYLSLIFLSSVFTSFVEFSAYLKLLFNVSSSFVNSGIYFLFSSRSFLTLKYSFSISNALYTFSLKSSLVLSSAILASFSFIELFTLLFSSSNPLISFIKVVFSFSKSYILDFKSSISSIISFIFSSIFIALSNLCLLEISPSNLVSFSFCACSYFSLVDSYSLFNDVKSCSKVANSILYSSIDFSNSCTFFICGFTIFAWPERSTLTLFSFIFGSFSSSFLFLFSLSSNDCWYPIVSLYWLYVFSVSSNSCLILLDVACNCVSFSYVSSNISCVVPSYCKRLLSSLSISIFLLSLLPFILSVRTLPYFSRLKILSSISRLLLSSNCKNSLNLPCGKTTDLVKSDAVRPTISIIALSTLVFCSAITVSLPSIWISVNIALYELALPDLFLFNILSTQYFLLLCLLPISNIYFILALLHDVFIYSLVSLDIFPYIAIVIASSIVDFPLPVFPNIPNRPLDVNSLKSITCFSI